MNLESRIAVTVFTAVLVGLVATQAIGAPVGMIDCESHLLRPECFIDGDPLRGRIDEQWLISWRPEWSDAMLFAMVVLVTLVVLLGAARVARPRYVNSA
jgi:hypothetical protein